MKIAINCSSLRAQKTGIGFYINNLCEALYLEGLCELSLFDGLNWVNELSSDHSNEVISRGVVSVAKYLPKEIKNKIREHFFKTKIRSSRLDLYHEPNFIPICFDLPTIITVHDMSIFRMPAAHRKELVSFFNKKFPEAIKRSQGIIVDSNFSKDEVISYFPEVAHKIFVVHLAPSRNFYPRTFQETQLALNIYHLEYKKYFLSVGTMEPRKNLITMLRAFKSLPQVVKNNYPLVIVGGKGWGGDQYLNEFQEIILNGQVKFLGYVDEVTLPYLYSGATLMAYPSIYEGFGLPPIEAMSCGTPVVVSNTTSLPEVVGNAGIQISPLDVDQLKEVMLRIIEDKIFSDEIVNLGIKQAKNFTWQKTAQQTYLAYQKTLNI